MGRMCLECVYINLPNCCSYRCFRGDIFSCLCSGRADSLCLEFVIKRIALFGIISFLIIFNTIRVSINTQRTEISIKRLVGASNWFIRGPYLIEAILFSIVSIVFTFGIVFIAFI